MPNERPDPDSLLHLIELPEIQEEDSETDTPVLIIAVISTIPMPLPNTVMLFAPVESIAFRTLETIGKLNETATFD
jgi:hypothetical protein